MNLPRNTVRLAVTSEDHTGLEARVGQHFGRCPAYTLVDVEAGRIGTARVVANPFVRRSRARRRAELHRRHGRAGAAHGRDRPARHLLLRRARDRGLGRPRRDRLGGRRRVVGRHGRRTRGLRWSRSRRRAPRPRRLRALVMKIAIASNGPDAVEPAGCRVRALRVPAALRHRDGYDRDDREPGRPGDGRIGCPGGPGRGGSPRRSSSSRPRWVPRRTRCSSGPGCGSSSARAVTAGEALEEARREESRLILAVASGKGGTGKTTLAVSLVQAAARSCSGDVALLDLDVEAPNAALFLDPVLDERRRAGVPVPEVDPERCVLCGQCVELCRSHALADLGSSVLILPELCIGCGVCVRHCPQRAMHEVEHELGTLEAGRAGRIAFAQGRLDPGRAQPTPLIRALKSWQLPPRGGAVITILDAPPGASCPVMEAARGADHVLLVTEPSPFGLHDLEKAVGALRDAMGLDVSVVINRSLGRDEADRVVLSAAGSARAAGHPLRARDRGRVRRGHVARGRATRPRGAARVPPAAPADKEAGRMKQLVVLSGKGGTGKTSVAAALAELAARELRRRPRRRRRRRGEPRTPARERDRRHATLPGLRRRPHRRGPVPGVRRLLRRLSLRRRRTRRSVLDRRQRPARGARRARSSLPGRRHPHGAHARGLRMLRAATRLGPLFHGDLLPGQENTGKLVAALRSAGTQAARDAGAALVLVDGPPGIGCPVLAACTGADLALLVTEPSLAAHHDLERILETLAHLSTPAVVCLNKADLHADSRRASARSSGAAVCRWSERSRTTRPCWMPWRAGSRPRRWGTRGWRRCSPGSGSACARRWRLQPPGRARRPRGDRLRPRAVTAVGA